MPPARRRVVGGVISMFCRTVFSSLKRLFRVEGTGQPPSVPDVGRHLVTSRPSSSTGPAGGAKLPRPCENVNRVDCRARCTAR